MKHTLTATLFTIATIALCLGGSGAAVAQQPIAAGSKVYIEPMNGFETYMAAAIEKKKVPLIVVSDENGADYVITGNAEHQKAGWAKVAFTGNIHSDEQASVSMVSTKTKELVFAYSVNKKNTLHGEQTSAEACAKHLKEKIEKGKE
jgi:hypothetical protein